MLCAQNSISLVQLISCRFGRFDTRIIIKTLVRMAWIIGYLCSSHNSLMTAMLHNFVLQPGYMLFDRVIRPAEVGVTQEAENDAADKE